MHICIIANGYPNNNEPQYGCFEKDQALALSKFGHKVSIIYVDGRRRKYRRKTGILHVAENNLQVYGIYIFPISVFKIINSRIHYWIASRLLQKVFSRMVKEQCIPDVLYAHYMYNIAYAVRLKVKYGIPLVGIEHWSVLTQESLSPLQRYWGEMAYSNTDRLLAVSAHLSGHIYRHFKKESTVVPDMLGPEFLQGAINVAKKSECLTFVSVGNLLPIKCFDLLIEAFANSHLEEYGCKLKIVGDGTERGKLEKLITDNKLQSSVLLVGRKNKDEVKEILSRSHVYILSSKAETFGVACIEALSQGLPVIATRCGGPEEFINDMNGVLLKPDNIEALSDAMKKMYNNYGNYNRREIANDCLSKYSPMIIANQLNGIFDELLE